MEEEGCKLEGLGQVGIHHSIQMMQVSVKYLIHNNPCGGVYTAHQYVWGYSNYHAYMSI